MRAGVLSEADTTTADPEGLIKCLANLYYPNVYVATFSCTDGASPDETTTSQEKSNAFLKCIYSSFSLVFYAISDLLFVSSVRRASPNPYCV